MGPYATFSRAYVYATAHGYSMAAIRASSRGFVILAYEWWRIAP